MDRAAPWAAVVSVVSISCGSQWADMDTSCATAKPDCTEKCEVEKAESHTIGPACAFEAVNYVESHRDALAAETDPQLVHLRVQTYAACSNGSARGCAAHRAVVATITSRANGTSNTSRTDIGTASAATTPSTASTAPVTPPAAACDPVGFVKAILDPGFAQRADEYTRENGQGPVVAKLGDLNGDGESEVEVDVFDGFRNHDIYVLEAKPAPTCFRKTLEGWNLLVTVATTSTNGWKDLNVDELILGQGAPQNVTFVGRYGGQKYALKPKR